MKRKKKKAKPRPRRKKQKKTAKKRKKTARRRAQVRAKNKSRRAKSLAFQRMKPREASAVISAHLSSCGHNPVLIGEACAYIYSGKAAPPGSIEFAIDNYSVDVVRDVMKEIGFSQRGEHAFVNRSFPIEVVIIAQPISVGDDIVEGCKIVRTARGPIRVLTPTDCVRHRLSHFFRCQDSEALSDAVRVARKQKIDMDLVRRWSGWEWAGDKFEKFLEELHGGRR